MGRSTPYHFPHTTQVAGSAFVYGGDDRFYNNLFIGGEGMESGTAIYNPYTSSYEEFIDQIIALGVGDDELFKKVEQPVYIAANAYYNGANAFDRGQNALVDKSLNPRVKIVDEGEEVYLEMDVPQALLDMPTKIISTETLGTVRIVDAIYDAPNGNPITLEKDYLGKARSAQPVVGPIEGLKPGTNRIKVWG